MITPIAAAVTAESFANVRVELKTTSFGFPATVNLTVCLPGLSMKYCEAVLNGTLLSTFLLST